MDTEKPDALYLADALKNSIGITSADVVASELLRLCVENETLRAGYSAARLEIASLQAQLEAVGAGGVEPLRKRECLHQITEPVQPVVQDAERYRWLRDNRSWQVLHRIRPGKSIEYRMRDDGDWWGHWWPTHEQAVDAARAAQEKK